MMRRSKAPVMLAPFVFAALALMGAPCLADPLSPDRARDLVRLQKILPLEVVLARAPPGVEGDVVEVVLEAEGDRFLYRIKALGRDGRYHAISVDATADASAFP